MSGSTFDPETIVVGVIGRPHGVRGEVKLRPFNAHAGLIDGVADLILEKDGRCQTLRMISVRSANRELIVCFEGIDSREDVASLTGAAVRVPRAALPPLDEGEFYVGDLPGCDVVDEDGRSLGAIVGTFWNGAHDVMTVSGPEGQGEHLIPVVPKHIVSVDAGRRKVVVRWHPAELG